MFFSDLDSATEPTLMLFNTKYRLLFQFLRRANDLWPTTATASRRGRAHGRDLDSLDAEQGVLVPAVCQRSPL